MILHLVSQADWRAAPADRPYLPKDFARDGFIHCTQGDELMLQVANRFYKDTPGDFLVLEIDETKVKAEVKWEAPVDSSATIPQSMSAPTLFPHIYGPLNRDAIVGIHHVMRAADGAFTGYENAPNASIASDPNNPLNLKSPSQMAKELLDETDEFSEALKRYKDSVEGRMDEMDKKIKGL
jgi:uncharacterized protein (DUF952 family)